MRLELYWEKYLPGILSVGLKRAEKAGEVLRDEARSIIRRNATTKKTRHLWKEHGPYRTGKDAGKSWTARQYYDMEKTVRVVTKKEPYGWNYHTFGNVRVYAGNYDIWYAKQMEYGNGRWRGGRRSFLRPAIRRSASKMKGVIENG